MNKNSVNKEGPQLRFLLGTFEFRIAEKLIWFWTGKSSKLQVQAKKAEVNNHLANLFLDVTQFGSRFWAAELLDQPAEFFQTGLVACLPKK